MILRCVAALTLKAVRSRDILKIKRETFIANWEPMKAALFMAVDFVLDTYGVRSDNYEQFIDRRANAIALALNVKLLSMTQAEADAAS